MDTELYIDDVDSLLYGNYDPTPRRSDTQRRYYNLGARRGYSRLKAKP